MGNDPFSFIALNFNGIQGGNDCTLEEAVFHGRNNFPDVGILKGITSLPFENEKEARLFKAQNQHQHQREPKFDGSMLEEFSFNPLLQPSQPFQETSGLMNQEAASSGIVEHDNKPVPSSSFLASLELLSTYGSRLKRLSVENISNPIKNTSSVSRQKLSTEEIIKVAGERYVQFSTNWSDMICTPMHPYRFGLGDLSEEENRDVELVQCLLTAADRIGYEQFERASKLLSLCQLNSTACAGPVQKVVFYFAQALRERIAKETGTITTLNGSEKREGVKHGLHCKIIPNLALVIHKKLPFVQLMHLTGVQAIVEQVASEKKIHMIDLDIRYGVHWTTLMQALAQRHERPVQLLKITAIGFIGKTKLEETGECLASLAESLNLPFSYKTVYVEDMMEINEDRLDIDDDEAIAVYCPYSMRTMVSRPECLENWMGVLRNMKPCIMVVLEIEANHNSPSFVNRFIEALFFFSALMDSIETCLKEDDECRMRFEAFMREGIRNILAMEGSERKERHVKLDVWRRFFARYKVVETGFSETCLYQTDLIVKEFACGNFCTVDKNGKSLAVGWKGTPLFSLSAWRFL